MMHAGRRAWRQACPGCRDEGTMGNSHQGESGRPGKWQVVCTEDLQPKRTEKLGCLRFPKESVLSHMIQRNGKCLRWGQQEEFIDLLYVNCLPQDSGKENEVWWPRNVIFGSYLASLFTAEKVGDLGGNGVAEWLSLVRLMQVTQ